MAPRKSTSPVTPVEEDIFEEVDGLEELDDLEELEEPAPAPAKRTSAAKKAAPASKAPVTEATSEYDSNWLAAYVTEETGVKYDSRSLRMLLRKLAKDGTLEREIGTDRSRYVFPKGPNNVTVKQVIKLVKSGEAQAVKREGLEKVKAATPAKKATTRSRKAATS